MEDVIAAAKKAACHDFIMSLPEGYDTVVAEGGATLSGGEKQRIAIARAIMKDAPIIILDEATANVDPENEKELTQAIENLTKGKTIIISEHRLWYLKDLADRVLHLEEGQIAHEWSGAEFSAFSDEKLRSLMLRPLSVNNRLFSFNTQKGDNEIPEISDEMTVVLKDFYFSYKRKPYLLFRKKPSGADTDSLDLNIPQLRLPVGSVTGIIGRNGTGKSTFLRCLCGLERDCPGVIALSGKEYKRKKRTDICYMVMQDVNHQLFTDSVMAEVMLSMKEKDEKECESIIDSLGLLPFKDKHPMALSGGQKQRVAIASAFAAGAKILLFDEPTSGLDLAHMEKVGRLLTELAASGRTVLVSTHDTELIGQCCDYLLYIENGCAAGLEKI